MVEILKQVIADVMESRMIADVCIGTVMTEKPLKIRLENGLELEERFLLVAERLTKHEERGRIRTWTTQEGNTWSEYRMIRDVGLKVGEKVMVWQGGGGQQYVVMDRWKGGTA